MTQPPTIPDPYGNVDRFAQHDGPPSALPGAGDPAAAPSEEAAVGPEPGKDLGADLGEALKFTGLALVRNPLTYLLSGLLYVAVMIAIIIAGSFIAFFASFATIDPYATSDPPVSALLIMFGVIGLSTLIAAGLMVLWQAGAARSAQIVLEGGRPRFGQALIGPGRIIVTALLIGVMVTIGSLLLYVPGLIAAVLTMYAIPAAMRGASPVEALKESFRLVRANPATSIVAWLIIGAASTIASLFMIPLLILVPFMVLFQVGLYERLNGRRLPAPAQG